MLGTYSKGYMATVGTVITAGMQMSEAFCHTWWPALAAFLTTVGVIIVPNAKKSDV